MFDYKHYVPVLKGKRAEFPALGALRSKLGLSPMIEMVPGGAADFVPIQMNAVWPTDRVYFIDLLYLDDEAYGVADAATHPLTGCFADVARLGHTAIPVTSLDRSEGYQAALSAIVQEQRRGFGLRLSADDFEDDEELAANIDALLSFISVSPQYVDIFVDSRAVIGASPAEVAQLHRARLSLLPHIADWRTLTVVAGAFPAGMAPLTSGQWNRVPRSDWNGWIALQNRARLIARRPSYGDYGIGNTELPYTGRATILAQLRYTIDEFFFVWKGGDVHRHPRGFDQFIDICADLVTRPEFHGAAFSWGDQEIANRAATPGPCGNAETWRKIGTNHHIEKVKVQIASLP